MSKRKPEVKMESCGLYSLLNKADKELPKLIHFTEEILCRIGNEFGYILPIRKGRGMKLTFQIDHPPFLHKGETAAPFTGEEYIRSNDWRFFLGDTTWEPIEDKAGEWRIHTWIDGDLVADRTLLLIAENRSD